MLFFILKRFGMLIIVIIGITLITFTISHIIPGDPAKLAAGPKARAEQIEQVRKELGLDKPLYQQYFTYLSGLIKGDLGTSITTRRSVTKELAEYFPATLELVIFALIFELLIGIPIGILSARYRNSVLDHASRLVSLSGVSIPLFWLGVLLQLIFYVKLGWLPAEGRIGILLSPPARITGMYVFDSLISGNWKLLLDSLKHILLPSFALAFGSMAIVTRILRTSMLEVLRQDYILTARAKGFKESGVITRHALKNAMIPTITVIGLQTGALLSGVFLIEIVFDWPGMGMYAINSLLKLDYFAIMGVTIVVALIYVIINFFVDIIYSILDPRISIGGNT